jgi:hypothetical protein
MNQFEQQPDEQSPYVEDKALTWSTMSTFGKIAVSASALAVGAFVAQPMLPAVAAIIGSFGNEAPSEQAADSVGPASAPTGPNASTNVISAQPGNSTAVAPAVNVNPAAVPSQPAAGNQAANTSTSAGASKSLGSQSPALNNTNLNFGNVSSATPSVGGANGNAGWSGKGHGGDDGGRENEREGNDD